MGSSRRRGPGLRVRLRYLIDQILSNGAMGLLVLAIVVSALILLVIAPILWIISGIASGHWQLSELSELYWQGITTLYHAGNGQGQWIEQLVTFVFAIVAIFFSGVIISSLVRATSNRFNRLRDEGGTIIAHDHSVILGWSTLGPRVLSDLAYCSDHRDRIAILTDMNKIELEDKLSELPVQRKRVIVRKGSTTRAHDFDRVRLIDAKHVVVLGRWGSSTHDLQVISMLLALARYRESHPEFTARISTCIIDPPHLDPAFVAAMGHATIMPVRVTLANLTVHVARKPGLFHVVRSLVDFSSNSIRLVAVAELVGQTFAAVNELLAEEIAIGVRRDDQTMLFPDPDLVIDENDFLILITSDTARRALHKAEIDQSAISVSPHNPADHSDMDWLFLGWAPSLKYSLGLLSVELGDLRNSVTVVVKDKDLSQATAVLGDGFPNLDLTIEAWPATESIADMLAKHDVGKRDYIVLPCRDETATDADAETLVVLLNLRQLIARLPASEPKPTVVSELLESKYQSIADSEAARDIVVTSLLVAHLVVQFVRDPRVQPVYRTIFSEASPDIELYPAAEYIALGQEVSFATVSAAAAQRQEIAIGYAIDSLSARRDQDFGIVVNPAKSTKITFAEGDRIVVIRHRHVRLGLESSSMAMQQL